MQIGQGKHGMITLNQSLANLYLRRLISMDIAVQASSDPEELRTMIMNAGGNVNAAPGAAALHKQASGGGRPDKKGS
jgi:Tfp pilus assembly ATPase PilU